MLFRHRSLRRRFRGGGAEFVVQAVNDARLAASARRSRFSPKKRPGACSAEACGQTRLGLRGLAAVLLGAGGFLFADADIVLHMPSPRSLSL